MWMLQVNDPTDAFPDYSGEAQEKIKQNAAVLATHNVAFHREECDLLATEDNMLGVLERWSQQYDGSIVVLDISSLPKRWFCFLLRRLIGTPTVENLVVTYTEVGSAGYSEEHLAEDPMPCDHLPGFGGPMPPSNDRLVVSVGFEPLNMSSLIRVYRDRTRDVAFLLGFPPAGQTSRREWETLRSMAAIGGPKQPPIREIEVISVWDVEQVYRTLERWNAEYAARASVTRRRTPPRGGKGSVLSLAPFGPKPHSLAMALFAIKHGSGVYYTQPKAYNPNYALGAGTMFGYVVKWRGIPCYDRRSDYP